MFTLRELARLLKLKVFMIYSPVHLKAKTVMSLAVLGMCWLVVGAATNAIAVISRVSGSAVITMPSGTSHELGVAEPLRSGATVVTGLGSLAAVNIDQVGRVQLGPQTTATMTLANGGVSLRLASGSLCIVSQSQDISVTAGTTRVALAAPATIFDMHAEGNVVKIAVFRGGVVVGGPHTPTATTYAGRAFSIDATGKISDVQIAALLPEFSSLKCPDESVVREAVPASESSPLAATKHSNGTGIFAGLLALVAIAAAAGHGGGNSSTQTPTFGPVSLSASSVSVKVGGPPVTLIASESGYSGVFTPSASSCGGIASVNPPQGTTFSLSGVAAGNCPLTLSDNRGQTARSLIFVTSGTIFISPQTLELSGTGNTQSFTVSESSPATFSATSSALTVATVTLVASTPNAATFNVTAISGGRATIMVSDTLAGAGAVSVGVGQAPLFAQRRARPAPSPKLPAPIRGDTPARVPITGSSIPAEDQLTTSTAAIVLSRDSPVKSFTVFERGYAGQFSALSTDPNVANVVSISGSGDTRTITVAFKNVGAAFIRVSDDGGAQRLVKVVVLPERQTAPHVGKP